ncbi:hypothetical protein WJX72_004836 [[Myrmecia] bisecta]|uniref:RNase III domain-containing protein n=1 Tax=[Myrmecia] bisecta TaxID=41462 RepID=A0AAW1PU69_9CHLO
MATHRHKWTGRTVPRLPSSTWPAGSASACAAAQTDWTSQPGNKQSQARNQQASKKKLSKSTHTSTHNSVQAVNFQERDKEAVPSHALYAFPAAKQAQQYCVIHTFCTNPKGSEPIKLPWTTGSWQLVSEELVSVRGPNTEADWEKLTDALPASSDEAKQSLLHKRAKQLQVNEVAARVVADSAAAESSALATDAACITAEAANNGVPLTKSASPRTTVDAVAVVVPPTETAAPSSAAAKLGFDSTGRCPDPLADLPRWRVEALLGLPVCNLDLYRAAFTCSSVLPDDLVVDKSFERLEYLGDSVLELAIRDYIFKRYPTATEGFLSQLQQSLGSGRAVYDYAWHLHLERFLVLNISAMVASKAQRYSSYSKVTGDVFEAVVAAVYLEHGYETAKRWIIKIMEELVDFNRAVEGRLAWQTLVRYANKNKLGRLEFNTRFGAAEKLQAGQAKAQEWIRRNAGRWLEEQWVSQVMLSTGEVLGCGSDIHRSTAELLASQDAIARLGASAPHILQAADLRFRA